MFIWVSLRKYTMLGNRLTAFLFLAAGTGSSSFRPRFWSIQVEDLWIRELDLIAGSQYRRI
jgi:hypothetical protein